MSEHYKFPNTSEVIDVTRYLSSNGGQAVQYIARSTRMDGNNKGDLRDRLKDLEKARDFITDEELRLESIIEDDDDEDGTTDRQSKPLPNPFSTFGRDGSFKRYDYVQHLPIGTYLNRYGNVCEKKSYGHYDPNSPFIHLGNHDYPLDIKIAQARMEAWLQNGA